MLAPEFVVYTAWSQWRTARKLTEMVTKNPEAAACNVEWSMTHSFFALMGGFAVDTDDPGEDAYIRGSPRLHLTANGVAVLAEIGQLPSISRDDILDKSKADHFAKTLVLIQAGWLMVECIARAADHLPLSLLELNTVAHIACAVITYALWWNKPLDVRQPVVLTGEWKRPLVAAMCMFSQPERNSPPEIEAILHYLPSQQATAAPEHSDDQVPETPMAELQHMYRRNHPSGPLKISSRRARGGTSQDISTPRVAGDSESFVSVSDDSRGVKDITLYDGDVLLPLGFGPKRSSKQFRWEGVYATRSSSGSGAGEGRGNKPRIRLEVDPTTLARWSLACQSLDEHHGIWAQYRTTLRTSQRGGMRYAVCEYPEWKLRADFVCRAVSNWPNKTLIPHGHEYTGMAFFSLCVVFYGGIHAVAWNDYFPTDSERLFWRLSAVYVGASGLLWLGLKALQFGCASVYESFVRNRVRKWFGSLSTPVGAIFLMVPLYVMTVAASIYVTARFYLVLEAFLSLRDVPLETYLTPEWSRYLVHF